VSNGDVLVKISCPAVQLLPLFVTSAALATAVHRFAEFYWRHMAMELHELLPFAEANVAAAQNRASDPQVRQYAALLELELG
jgi:uncharacterized membrane protein YcfT